MGIEAVSLVFEEAVQQYIFGELGANTIPRRNLLPLSVFAADRLVGRISPLPRSRDFTHVASSPSTSDWEWLSSQLVHSKLMRSELMLDIVALRGWDDPFDTLVTIESESDCDPMRLWDFYKLLQVASPCRVYVTMGTQPNLEAALFRLRGLVPGYQGRVSPGDVFSVQIPKGQLSRHPMVVAHWPNGRWAEAPAVRSVILDR